jgi:Co/Zn/Cd efflux system component
VNIFEGALAVKAMRSRNDILANIAIILAGVVTACMPSAWPHLIVGLGIAAMNADAGVEVWRAAREEHRLSTLP